MTKTTPENFAPYMATAINEAAKTAHLDPSGPMNALIAGLTVFRDLIVGQEAVTQEKIIPGFVFLRHAITSVMKGDLDQARFFLEQYSRDHPSGVFARAVTEDKVIQVMTLMIQPMTQTAFCRRCKENTAFEVTDQGVATCSNCQNQTFIIRHK